MWIAQNKAALKDYIRSPEQPIVLVPTMGALHRGHTALIDRARQKAGPKGLVLVSIFVNPIQFDRIADLEKYPRPIEADLALCKKHGVDGVFQPQTSEMYSTDRSVSVAESSLSKYLCGATRPGHFDGVCTVVVKLFNLTRCDAAVFGEKDFQQLSIINRMVRDLDLDVEIIAYPTIRELDGLALSSRNSRLPPLHRADAPCIFKALQSASDRETPQQIIENAKCMIDLSANARIDYISLVEASTLAPATCLSVPTVLACAVFYGDVRLIDHIDIAAR